MTSVQESCARCRDISDAPTLLDTFRSLARSIKSFAGAGANAYGDCVSTAQEIEDAIRSLSPSERDKLRKHIPQIFPEFAGDPEWERIARDNRPRPALTELINRHEETLSQDPEKLPKIAESDFESRA